MRAHISVLLAAALSGHLDATPAPRPLPACGKSGATQIVSVRGTADAATLVLQLQAGPVATRGVRVYSEPSHTLLLMAIDAAFYAEEAGKAWVAENRNVENAAALIAPQLPGSIASVIVPARPITDTRVAVWVFGTWPSGKTADQLKADGLVGAGSFSFASSIPPNVTDPDDPVHCCEGNGCSQMCVECSGPRFSCCLNTPPGCCDIGCGWFYPCCQ